MTLNAEFKARILIFDNMLNREQLSCKDYVDSVLGKNKASRASLLTIFLQI